jgi:carbamoyl-phosphate synthase small subunit
MLSTTGALLVLSDGYTARGMLCGKPGTTIGKLVFNTSMTGYQEILTDPSYAGEIITFTFPLIGIYGACPADAQSERIHARGLIVGELSEHAASWRADRTLLDVLLYEGVTGIRGIDTRRLTRHIRDQGEMLGVVTSELPEAEARAELARHPDFGQLDLVPGVSCKQPYVVEPIDPATPRTGLQAPYEAEAGAARAGGREFTVAAYDFGIKRGILRCLAERGCRVHVFPATATAGDLLGVNPHGVFLSNGPGDPERMSYVLPHVQRLSAERPTFGICLGHQLLALSAGIPTYRLKFGNRGANHPVLDLETGRAHISSQNHSYAVALAEGPAGRPAAAPLPDGTPLGRERAPLGSERPTAPYPHPLNGEVLVTHLNVNDGSNEGLAWRERPVFSVQYHPEGCPGPRDNVYLFDKFIELMARG